MTLSKTLSILFLASSLAVVGCKKKEEVTPATPAAGSAKPAETAPTPAAPAATPAAPAAPSGNTTFTSDDDYIAKQTVAMDKVIEIFKGAGTDCDKLAAGLTKFADDNKGLMVAAEEYSKAHADAKKKFDEASKSKMGAFEAAANPAMTACKDSKKVEEAMAKLSSD